MESLTWERLGASLLGLGEGLGQDGVVAAPGPGAPQNRASPGVLFPWGRRAGLEWWKLLTDGSAWSQTPSCPQGAHGWARRAPRRGRTPSGSRDIPVPVPGLLLVWVLVAVGLQTCPSLPRDPEPRTFRGQFLWHCWLGMLPVPLLCRRLRWKNQKDPRGL